MENELWSFCWCCSRCRYNGVVVVVVLELKTHSGPWMLMNANSRLVACLKWKHKTKSPTNLRHTTCELLCILNGGKENGMQKQLVNLANTLYTTYYVQNATQAENFFFNTLLLTSQQFWVCSLVCSVVCKSWQQSEFQCHYRMRFAFSFFVYRYLTSHIHNKMLTYAHVCSHVAEQWTLKRRLKRCRLNENCRLKCDSCDYALVSFY